MPVWSVSEPYLDLWLHDEPLGYQPAKGPAVVFRLDYKQRETNAGVNINEFNAGQGWNCSWLSYVKPGWPNNMVHLPEGGLLGFDNSGSVEFYSSTRLVSLGLGVGFELIYPDGRTNVYKMQAKPDGSPRFYLTEMWDRSGQKLTFVYENQGGTDVLVARLLRVIDADGRTNTLTYATSGWSTNQIISVTDGFGRTNSMAYDSNGCLTNLTDIVGISASFQYDTNNWMTQMTTPYGLTTFTTTVDDTNYFYYGLQVTDAGGGNHLWLYQWTNQVSYYWGPRQFDQLTHASDLPHLNSTELLRARSRKWSGILDNTVLMWEQAFGPVTDTAGQVTRYQYVGSGGMATNRLPQMVSQVLPDGTTNFVWMDRTVTGVVTNQISTYTKADGSVGTRTNRFVYSDDGFDLLETYDVDGNRTAAMGYVNHLPVTQTNVLGEVTTYTYNTNGQVTSVLTPYGLLTTNIYFASDTYSNWLSQTIDSIAGLPQRTNSFTYTNGLVYTRTDERGNTTTNYWDGLSRLRGTGDALGKTTNSYNPANSPLDIEYTVDRMGFTNRFVYDAMRRLTDKYDSLGRNTHYEYCTCGNLDFVVDATGTNFTRFYYDAAGRRIKTVGPDGFWVTNNLDSLGRVISTTDSAGTTIKNCYNNQGLVYAVSNNVGRVSYRQFDNHDRVVSSVDANNVTVTNIYDVAGRVTATGTPANGAFTTYGYTLNMPGVSSITNALTNVTAYAYDAYGRKTNEISGGVTTALTTNRFAYDAAGALKTLTDGDFHTTTWKYDQFGRVTSKMDHLGTNAFQYGYDADNRLTNRVTPAKGMTRYSYDKAGNLTNVAYPSSPAISLSYDAMNRLTTMVDGVGTNVYAYNSIGQLLSEDGPWGDDTVNYGYTGRQRTSLTLGSWNQAYVFDSIKRLQTVTSPAGPFTYNYNASQMSRVDSLTLPGGGYITNQFDLLARMTDTRYVSPDRAILNGHDYVLNNGNQRTKQTRFSQGTTNFVDYSYDPLGEVTSAIGKEAGGVTNRLQEQFGYAYDPAGNLTFRTNNALVQSFVVDSLNQLTNISRSGTLTVSGKTSSQSTNVAVNGSNAVLYADFTFAQAGFTVTNGLNSFTAVAKDAYGHADTNTISAWLPASTSFFYDSNGNLTFDGTNNYAYDDENQLVSAWQTNNWRTDFAYDGKLRCRIVKEFNWTGSWTLNKETHLVYDGMLVIQERDGSNNVQVSYTRGNDLSGSLQGAGGIGGLLARTDSTQSNPVFQTGFYHCDGNGNITALISPNGLILAFYLYDPYGRALAQSGPLADANLYRFSSKMWHEHTALYYYGYRFYSPNLQRWLNKDPIQEEGGINLYEFVGDDGINIIDIYGRFGDGQTILVGTGYVIQPVNRRDGTGGGFHYYTASEIFQVSLGHSDFDNPFGDFDFTGEDHSFTDAPYSPWGIHNHFQDYNTSLDQVFKAIDGCDIRAYNKSMHRLQDWWTHMGKGYTGYWWGIINPISLILSAAGVHGSGAGHVGSILPWNANPDNDNAAWYKAEIETEYLNAVWYSSCTKDCKGGWGRRQPCAT
jgi:RHS repeat-associated protein